MVDLLLRALQFASGGMMNSMRKLFILLIAAILFLPGCSSVPTKSGSADQDIADAFENHRNGLMVSGSGVVERVLSDDTEGARHQRFILRLDSGQTLLITHNIDIAPRISGLSAGDSVEFSGQYEWNDKGGVVHWTHHDPNGRHQAGWIKHGGVTYR
jgi:hypothetical protein